MSRTLSVSSLDVLCASAPVIWSLNIVGTKYGISHGFAPLSFGALRFIAAGAIFAGLTFGREGVPRVDHRGDRRAIVIAIALTTVNQIAFVFALRLTTAVTVGLMLGIVPCLVALLAAAGGVERLSRRIGAAGLVSFVGVALVVIGVPGGIGSLGGETLGICLALVAPLTFSALIVIVARPMKRYSASRVSALIQVGVAVPMLLFALPALAHQDFASPSVLAWGTLAYGSLGALVIGNILWFNTIRRVGPSRASFFSNLQPFLAALFAALLLNERVAPAQVAGGALIAVGIVLSRPASERSPTAVASAVED